MKKIKTHSDHVKKDKIGKNHKKNHLWILRFGLIITVILFFISFIVTLVLTSEDAPSLPIIQFIVCPIVLFLLTFLLFQILYKIESIEESAEKEPVKDMKNEAMIPYYYSYFLSLE